MALYNPPVQDLLIFDDWVFNEANTPAYLDKLVVHKAGTETITGDKTFTGTFTITTDEVGIASTTKTTIASNNDVDIVAIDAISIYGVSLIDMKSDDKINIISGNSVVPQTQSSNSVLIESNVNGILAGVGQTPSSTFSNVIESNGTSPTANLIKATASTGGNRIETTSGNNIMETASGNNTLSVFGTPKITTTASTNTLNNNTISIGNTANTAEILLKGFSKPEYSYPINTNTYIGYSITATGSGALTTNATTTLNTTNLGAGVWLGQAILSFDTGSGAGTITLKSILISKSASPTTSDYIENLAFFTQLDDSVGGSRTPSDRIALSGVFINTGSVDLKFVYRINTSVVSLPASAWSVRYTRIA